MPDVLIRDVDAAVLNRVKNRAKSQNRSLQAHLSLMMIRESEQTEPLSRLELARKIRASIKNVQKTDSVDLLREDRDR